MDVMELLVGYFLGVGVGVVIGLQYYKYQIVKRKNAKVIEQVKEWIALGEK